MSYKIAQRVSNTAISPPARKAVARVLADYAHEDGSSVYPSITTVALKTGLSEKQARRHVHGLLDDGFIALDYMEPGRTAQYHFDLKRLGPTDAEIKATRDAARKAKKKRPTPPAHGRGTASEDGRGTPPTDGSPTPPAHGSPTPPIRDGEKGVNPSHGREGIEETKKQSSERKGQEGTVSGEREAARAPLDHNSFGPHFSGTDHEEPWGKERTQDAWERWFDGLSKEQEKAYWVEEERRSELIEASKTPEQRAAEKAEAREQDREEREYLRADIKLVRKHLRDGGADFSSWERSNLPGILAALLDGRVTGDRLSQLNSALIKIKQADADA